MSAASAKGYRAEAAVQEWLRFFGPAYRPRAGSHRDTGDIGGLPFVVSVKDHARLALGEWIGDLGYMVENANVETGFVFHKRRGFSNPSGWYVTTVGGLMRPFIEAYLRGH